MAKITGADVLKGSNAKVFFDGEEIATFSNIEATITLNYEDVPIGFDVDRTPVSWQGEGTLSHQATNSIGVKLFNKLKASKDLRVTIECEMTKPSTGETQFTSLPNCSLDSIPLVAWGKGELVENEIAFRFLPSEVQNTQLID
jgi:hypothetical protein